MAWREIALLSGFFALLIAGYGGLYYGLIAFIVGIIVVLALKGVDAIERDKDR